ncbi:MAG: mechanosensitive ion channel family protein [Rhodospirillales bacterium]|nr:mechanosensitive ion channel family protein [Rhodospirillales bacterium]MDH3969773.1 mechanosensitive ion channel family protein [Rhodospirillales bacterium]
MNFTPKFLFEPMNEQIHYANQLLTQLTESIGSALPGVFAGLVVILAFFIAAVMSRKLLRRLSARVEVDKRPLIELAGETLRYVLMVVGLITGLGTMGIDVSALIAALGLTGFALGFALRDAVSNLVAGVLILLYRPFGYRDKITVAGNSGTVIGTNFRYTVLEADDGTIVHVPNSTMFSNSVTVAPRTGEVP